MKKILNLLKNNPALKMMIKGKGEIVTNEASDEAYLIASAFLLKKKTMIIVKENQYQALELYRELSELLSSVCYFPSDESLRIESVAYSYELVGERLNAMAMLRKEPCVCICHMHSLSRFITPVALFDQSLMTLKVGEIIDPQELRKKLIHIGYHTSQRVDSPFYVSRRGGVIDVYSIQYEDPIRIEFFDDEIESISFYDKDSQRRTQSVKEVEIYPATDMLFNKEEVEEVIKKMDELHEKMSLQEEAEENLEEHLFLDKEALRSEDYNPRIYQYLSLFSETSSILDYADNAEIITASYLNISKSYQRYSEENFYYFHEMQEVGEMLKGLVLTHNPSTLLKHRDIDFIAFKNKDDQVEFRTRPAQIEMINDKVFINQLKDYLTFDKVLICLNEKTQVNSMLRFLEEHQLSYTVVGSEDSIYDGINLYQGQLNRGLEFVDERVVLLTARELFHVASKKKGYVKYKDAKVLHDYNELNIGDYVVHDTNGIGQYMGIKTLVVKGVHKDFLYIAYKGNDILYVPVENFKLIRKYASRDGKVPQVHALNSTKWQKEKARVRAKVDGLADDLIALYAERMKQPGFAFEPDSEMQIEFENAFGYELTPDQKKAVDEIKADMELARPMDRLLCGDVGFGKTEVALRACFKAILSNKQCAFLCPTTILSSQHYRTMTKRFENFGVRIALLNRFTTTKQKKEILADLKEGKIDLLVGTHRILSKDVQFKDLGLLCIDEEQRFGVRQKEKIKEYRKTIDVLTLTATPIPRTLQMSLMGIRGLSQIETPPRNRLPVQTYVSERNVPLIKQVIERELARGGQVFYLYNKTETIESFASRIQQLVPNARIAIGHGRMDKDHLERIMEDFVNHEYDILICTTIVETGIDIPNANTIVIEDADHFGLAQLYQIKGRVGRSSRIAYAYLFYRKNKNLTEEGAKRLKAIKEFTALGSGYKIAMRDLSIRGSGDILGGEQAGFIDSVGFDMYMKILQEAIDEKQGKKEKEDVPTTNVKVDGYIPENYVESDMEKLELYQRIYRANSMKELDEVEAALKDLYGELPREICNIVEKRRFEILCYHPIIENVDEGAKGLVITFTKDYTRQADGVHLFSLSNSLFKKAKLSFEDNQLAIAINDPSPLPLATKFLKDIYSTLK
ncbi:transcription-repair coupling factor [Kandleria vitulina]|uniref:transcription-repair coupling factor n=1 Tax=Kandleria vitulina TaxID=1630 RepID=UPI00088818DC|nr:transcription-repair coupling factor [Kandleria vitulina]SDL20551.1 transcription-repair coupling factor [Kandleria vitulina]